MEIKTLMKTRVPAVPPEAPLADADLLMRREGLSVLPVVRGDALVGVVTDLDLRRAGPSTLPELGRWESPLGDRRGSVAELMRADVPTVRPDASVDQAAQLMAAAGLDCLPVAEGPSLLGMVVLRDLLAQLIAQAEAGPPAAVTTILVAVGTTVEAETAARTAVALACIGGARLVLLDLSPRASEAGRAERWREVIDAPFRELAAGMMTELCLEREAADGDRVSAIVGAARRWQADLVVMARPAGRRLRGSWRRRTVEAIARQAPCPVLTVDDAGRPMRVDEAMRLEVATAHPTQSLADASRRLADHGTGYLLVVDDDGRLGGILSEWDLAGAWPSSATSLSRSEVGGAVGRLAVAAVMTRDVVWVAPATPLVEAGRLLRDHRIGVLPVLENGRVVGVLTALDVVRALGARLSPAAISAR